MKKYLIRTNMSPFDNFDPHYVIRKNTIGTNSGNMVFAHSLFKTIMVDDSISIDTIRVSRKFSKEEADRINAEYDCFIMPLANAFRKSFLPELNALTKLINNLKIPCVVIGIGLQASVDAKQGDKYNFDDNVKKFVKSVLNKSSIIGVRGEITGSYLSDLGFIEDKDFTVIGCPSMYMNGRQLHEIKKNELTNDSLISMNRKPTLPVKFLKFIEKCRVEFPNHYCVPQNLYDLWLLYAGVPLSLTFSGKVPEIYPKKILDEIFINDKVRGFINVPSWLEHFNNVDFSFGSRIHGNIIPILTGTPSFIFVPDSRVLELVKYHNLPHMLIKNIKETTNILDIYEKTDFSSIHKGHAQRFDKYIDFLNSNGIDNIYNADRAYDILPFDKRISEIKFHGPITTLYGCTPEEQAERIGRGYKYVEDMLKHERNKSIFVQIAKRMIQLFSRK